MKTNIPDDQKHALEHLGFYPTFPDKDDKSFCVYQLDLKHSLLTGPFIRVDGKHIEVWCREDKRGLSGGKTALINFKIYREDHLLELIKQFL